jgi:chaperone required for assembly of F1-ATPase
MRATRFLFGSSTSVFGHLTPLAAMAPAVAPRFTRASTAAGTVRTFSMVQDILQEHTKLVLEKKTGQGRARLSGVKTNGKTPRFYRRVGVVEAEGEYAVTLGGRLIDTPHGNLFTVPSSKLAWAIAFEWNCQITHIKPHSMPLMHIATVAIDQMMAQRETTEGLLAEIIHTDQICHRNVDQPGLLKLQRKFQDPVLEWFERKHGCKINTTDTQFAVDQEEDTIEKVKEIIQGLNSWELAIVDTLTMVTRSLVVALAVVDKAATAKQCYEMARLEENYQIRAHGFVDGAFGHGIDQEFVRMKVSSCSTFLSMLRDKDNAVVGVLDLEQDAAQVDSSNEKQGSYLNRRFIDD